MQPTLYIMCGLAFSGKSTLAKVVAKHTGATLVGQDAIWFEQLEQAKQTGKEPTYLSVLGLSKSKVAEALAQGQSVVFDNTNAGRSHRKEFRQIAKEHNAKAIIVYANTSDDEIKSRQEANKVTKHRHDPSESDMQTVRDHFEPPTQAENVVEYLPSDNLADWLKNLPS